MCLIVFLGCVLNELFQYQISSFIRIITILFGVLIASIAGYQIYNHVEKKAILNYTEVFLTENQLEEYVLKGKKQFETHKSILLFWVVCTLSTFLFFIFLQDFIIYFCGILMHLMLVLLFMWIKPFKKVKFYKAMIEKANNG